MSGLLDQGDRRRPIWCEHCRDHFPTDHYADGKHQMGPEFGPVGVDMWILEAAEQVAYWWDPHDPYPYQRAEGWVDELQRRVTMSGRTVQPKDVRTE